MKNNIASLIGGAVGALLVQNLILFLIVVYIGGGVWFFTKNRSNSDLGFACVLLWPISFILDIILDYKDKFSFQSPIKFHEK